MTDFIARVCDTLKQHINIPKTLYFNFKVFDFKTAIKLPVFIYGSIDLEGIHKHCVELKHPRFGGAKIGGGWFTELFGYSQRHKSFLKIKGKLILGRDVTINQGAVISICENAVVSIGDDVRFNERLLLHSKQRVDIGNDCLFGWNAQIVDTDFHYIVNGGKVKYRTLPVSIGHHVWLANGVSVMKGTILPAYSVAASNSLLNKDYSTNGDHCLYGGIPAKVLKHDVERVMKNEMIVDGFFNEQKDDLCWDDIKKQLTESDL